MENEVGEQETEEEEEVEEEVVEIAAEDEMHKLHYGKKPGHFEISKIHCPTNERVSKVSKRANE